MLVVEVDDVEPESTERSVDRAGDLGGTEHATPGLALGRVDVLGELGGDHHPVCVRGQGFAEELLIDVRPVDLGGVEERDAEVDGPVQQRDHVLAIGHGAVAAGHGHAAQADG